MKTKQQVHELSLERITCDGEVQPRKGENQDLMREYIAAWLDGADFPPVDVFWDREADTYYLADGFHRFKSAIAARMRSIRAFVHLGTKRDAILFSVGANASHGLRRSNEDKRAAVLKLLDDAEWCLWSDSEIARACHVSPTMVGDYRGSATNVRGHAVAARVGANGAISLGREKAPDVPDRRTVMNSVPLTKREVHELYTSKIARHLRKHDPGTRLDVPYDLGTVEIATARRLYHTMIGRETDQIYRVVGRMVVARELLGPELGITLIGHFAPSTAALVAVLAGMDIECATPETILRRKEG